MSEKIYALLLRLYPVHFRRTYSGEARLLLRDRLRDETGLYARMRLWLDLLRDLAVSLPGEHSALRPAIETAAGNTTGTPSFSVLDRPPLRRGALLFAALLSLIGTGAFVLLLNYEGIPPTSRLAQLAQRAQERPSIPSAATAASSPSGIPTAANAGDAAVASSAPSPVAPPQNPRHAGAPATMQIPAAPPIDAAERHRVIAAAAKDLRASYFDPKVGENTAAALLAREKNGDDNAATTGAAFAALLTTQMHDASHDMHLVVEYSQNKLPDGPPPQTPESRALFARAMHQQNCTFRKVEVLPHDIGYIKLDFFPDPSVCATTAIAAMAAVNHARVIVFDLRDNTGGFPAMVSLMASYLFDHPVYWYSPRSAPTEQSFTHSPVPGSLLADKPVYVLTSSRTWSGAEQFSYDLKMLHRATLVGETTHGGAHAGVFHRIDDHFGMGIPEQRPLNPYSDHDWEGVGVTPDVKVKSADALAVAQKLAQNRLATQPQ
ncbi:MAG TPA: S41 family peptidase [Acidobacteriaceae bacterium]|jgi:hypothetical protein|nr:S41 family peptidase [Acidobacteriaceae bacterium]